MNKNLFTLTLLKAIEILDCFKTDSQEIGIKEISKMISTPESSVHRIVQSLEFVGMIIQNKENKKYRLGIKMLVLSDKMDCLNRCILIATKYMKVLNEECDETVMLAAANGDRIISLYKIETKQLLRPNYTIGEKYTMHNTGLGKVLLADMSPQVLEWVYNQNKKEINVKFEDFKSMIEEVRNNGYAFDNEEFQLGLRCVAAPIKTLGGKTTLAVSVSVPTVRLNEEKLNNIKELVIKYTSMMTEEISRIM